MVKYSGSCYDYTCREIVLCIPHELRDDSRDEFAAYVKKTNLILHKGSWGDNDGHPQRAGFRGLSQQLAPYVKEIKLNEKELNPISHKGSWVENDGYPQRAGHSGLSQQLAPYVKK